MIARKHFDGVVNAASPLDVRHPYQVTIPARILHGSARAVDWLVGNIDSGCWTWGYLINEAEAKINLSTSVVTFGKIEDALLFNLIFRE